MVNHLNLKKTPPNTKQKKPGDTDPWRILIVDDDKDVHTVTRMVLDSMIFSACGVELLSAYSAEQARNILQEQQDIALILLDIVMENDHAGLDLVRWIRQDWSNKPIRIIIRTGQPGTVPEQKVVDEYDINGYTLKSQLTARRLKTTVITALRSWRDITIVSRK